jgi:2-C-methyl-D-erythritol 4-phosphate cytidylyltransferase
MSIAALVLAAGRGERLGDALPKAFVPLAGRPLLLRSLGALAAVHGIDRLVPVVAPSDRKHFADLEADFEAELATLSGLVAPVDGGTERQHSVRAGVASLPGDVELVVVHDAARCLVRPEDVSRVIDVARRHGAAILATPVRDTIKRVEACAGDFGGAGRVIETPDRASCWAAQTPQVFRTDVLREALDRADEDGFLGSDDAQIVERLGVEVRIVEGPPGNLKLTHREDWAVAERWLAAADEGGAS